MMRRLLLVASLVCLSPVAVSQDAAVTYLANEGVMVWQGDTKILFDPLYDNSYGTYQMVPDRVRNAIFAGEAPYDGVQAVFVSHHHGDHFSAADMLRLLSEHPDIHFYAPAQAVSAVREIASADQQSVLDRMTGLDMEYGDSPVQIIAGDLTIDAAFIPHAGWPTARTDVQNIAFRVTLGNGTTVLHMGDADARTVHFNADEEYWEETTIDLAMPPYWYFLSEDGVEIMEDRLDVIHAVGIHAPDDFSNPSNRPEELLSYDVFTSPGEGRRF
ncbi:MAG: MBL fold metallo-hydrolase [Gammaproteobacteria bacterium]|nr:MBL fold metallo-hydrolase [Gammaproteobacteria bacterium]